MTLGAATTGLSTGRAAALRAPARTLESLKHDAVTELGGVLSGFWSEIEEQVRLAALAGHDFSAAQEDRVAVMALSHRALELATRFRDAIEKEFARWEDASEAPPKDRSLSLMSEAELEIHLAGQQITELLDHQFLHPLAQLDERLRQLSEALGVGRRRPNPMRPEVPVAAFVALFESDDLTPGLRKMVFHQFDKRLPKVLGDLYTKANATLDAAAFSASAAPVVQGANPARGTARHAASAMADGDGAWVPDGGIVPHLGSAGQAQMHGYASGGNGFAGVQAGLPAGEAPATMRVREQVLAESLAGGRPMRYRDLVRDQLRAWR